MSNKPFSITAKKLAEMGSGNIPDDFIPACHLIYSSPATLSYNSPGAVGFGVKRAALTLPESVLLLIGPAACGRNSSIMSVEEGFADKMFYLLMDETDLVTGRHLVKVADAIREIIEVCTPRPKSVIICLTCVDALLGTDLERVCRRAQKETGVNIVPSYMYALTREGRKPPMTAIRETIYSLVKRDKINPHAINLMGYFAPVNPESDLFSLLNNAGITDIQQIACMDTMEEYKRLGSANFNLVLDGESIYAADALMKRENMPYIEFHRLYHPEKIHRQYQLFAHALGITIDDEDWYKKSLSRWKAFGEKHRGKRLAIGEMANSNPYELAASLTEAGLEVSCIFSNFTENDRSFLERLARLSPDTEIFTGISPTMVHYTEVPGIDLSIGKDAGGYCSSSRNVEWFSETQPFGYTALLGLLDEMEAAL